MFSYRHPTSKKLSTIILAAGESKRMHSKTPKILHLIWGKPIILFVIDQVRNIKNNEVIIVINKNSKKVKKIVGPRIKFAVQTMPLGTGDAAKKGIDISANSNVLILCGDVPLLQTNTIIKLLDYHDKKNADLTFLTCNVKNPYGYGRIIRDRKNNVQGIVEQSDATAQQQKIKEINAGIYYGKKSLIHSALNKITTKNQQGEYYLTDVVREMLKKKRKVFAMPIDNEAEIIGINSKADLLKAKEIVKKKWFEQ